MKEKIEAKINEVLESIMSKDAKDITYNEYRILDNKLANLKWDESQQERNKDMAELMLKTIGTFGSSVPTPLDKEE